jgi:hypothetical protein
MAFSFSAFGLEASRLIGDSDRENETEPEIDKKDGYLADRACPDPDGVKLQPFGGRGCRHPRADPSLPLP